VASLGSSIRSAARATYSAYRTIPFRWRLAGGSAGLTLIILASFAVIVGVLTDRQVRTQFDAQQGQNVELLFQALNGRLLYTPHGLDCQQTTVHLKDIAAVEHAQIRIFDNVTGDLLCTQKDIRAPKAKAPLEPHLFAAPPDRLNGYFIADGYRVAVRPLRLREGGRLTLLYALPLSDINQTIAKVRVFLLLGVLGGTVLALLAGLFVSARASRPIVELTEAAREIQRTRDASKQLPHPEAQDEIAELARTLGGMLASLDAARAETLAALDRQREFVADASHELRTPLTSVLANLELLAEELGGEQAETAEAALRATRRMRRLVGDLLLLARADARRVQPHRAVDLAEVMVDAAAELGPVAERHELVVAPESVVVEGVRDELHRLVLNLLDNAVRHTPPGTRIQACTRATGDGGEITVSDDGPGIPPELAGRVFERFVRGGRDGARGSGLGLAIVRSVAESHGGTVELRAPVGGHGTRFVITLPLNAWQPRPVPAAEAQTSTTTGRTMGRRRSRS
jgi:two-component system OmpR family sensor kinase